MNNLVKTNIFRKPPTWDMLNTTGVVVSNGEIDSINYYEINNDMKLTPFTIRLLEEGSVVLLLYPYLNIDAVYVYNITTGDNYACDYSYDEPNYFISPKYNKGDEIVIKIDWLNNNNKRTLGFPTHPSTPYFDDIYFDTYSVCSSITCTGQYEIFGNLGSLLFRLNQWNYAPWKTDNYNNNYGSYTFAGLFTANNFGYLSWEILNESDLGWDVNGNNIEEDIVYIDAIIDTNNNLISAKYLYLPPLYADNAYMMLFAYCQKLQFGPKTINIMPYIHNCWCMFEYCISFSPNYNPIIYLENDSDTGTEEGLNMFYRSNLRSAVLDIRRLDDHAFGDSGARYIFNWCEYLEHVYINKYVVDEFSDEDDIIPGYLGNEVGTSTDHGSVIIHRMYTEPIIWLNKLNGLDIYSTASLRGQVESYEQYSVPYKFKGTMWIEERLRSYYLWERWTSHSYDTDAPKYVCTQQKDFTGMSLYDHLDDLDDNITSKIFYPVEYYFRTDISALDYDRQDMDDNHNEGLSSTPWMSQTKSRALYAWSGIVPDAIAGPPTIWVDRDFDIYGNDPLYDIKKIYRTWSKKYELVDAVDNDIATDYIFRCVWAPANPNDNNDYPVIDPKCISDEATYCYAIFNAQNFEDLYQDYYHDNYTGNQIRLCNLDGENYRTNNIDHYIVYFNGIRHDTCDYEI